MMDLFRHMSRRERWLVSGTAVFVGTAVLFGLVIQPLVEKSRQYESMAVRKRQDLLSFRSLVARYGELEATLKQLEQQALATGTGGSLLAVMESEAKKLGLADRITSMKPFASELESGVIQSSVEMRLEKIDLKGLVDLLEALERGNHSAATSRLRIKTRFDDPALLDVSVMVSTLEAG